MLPDKGGLAGPMHRARAETQSRVGVRGGVVRSVTDGGARTDVCGVCWCAGRAGLRERSTRSREHAGLVAKARFQIRGSLPAAAEPCVRGERPTAGPLLGTLLASLVGAPSTQTLGATDPSAPLVSRYAQIQVHNCRWHRVCSHSLGRNRAHFACNAGTANLGGCHHFTRCPAWPRRRRSDASDKSVLVSWPWLRGSMFRDARVAE